MTIPEIQAAIDSCPDLDSFNYQVVPVMREQEGLFRSMAAGESKRRGYRAVKSLGLYVQMERTKGYNLIRVGYLKGTLLAEFSRKDTLYEFADFPHEDYFKLLRSPFPDALWAKFRKREKAKAPAE